MKICGFILNLFIFLTILSCSTNNKHSDLNSEPSLKIPTTELSGYEGIGTKWAVSSQGIATSSAANEIFARGGNIVDAAVAASFTVGVERPQSTGIGGGGFVLLYLAKTKKIIALDFRERAPFKSKQNMFLDKKGEVIKNLSSSGALASATPGMVAGIYELHKKYGKLPWQDCLQPAIRLARNGFPVYKHLAEAIKENVPIFSKYKSSSEIFLHPDGKPLAVNEKLLQLDLAKTLEAIARHKAAGFYKGWVAEALRKTHVKYGGILSQKDLDSYRAIYREPININFEGYQLFSMPPPSSGGVHVAQILKFLTSSNENLLTSPLAPSSIDYTAKAMQFAFHDRSIYLGDPDFVKIPLQFLLSDQHALEVSNRIKKPGAILASEIGEAPVFKNPESPETTHFTLADNEGNILSSTQTINGWFGAGIVAEGAGFVLNNEMDDFSSKPGAPNKFGVIGGASNNIQPGKRPLSSMAPTIIIRNDVPIMGLGTPSGPRIITCVTLSILNYIHYGLPLNESIEKARYHNQWVPDELVVEPGLFSEELKTSLSNLGHKVVERDLGCKVQAVALEKSKGSDKWLIHGVSDKRGEGSVKTDLNP